MTQILKSQIMLKFLNMNDQSIKKKVQVVVIAKEQLLLFEFNQNIPNNYVGFQNITGGVEGEESFYEAAKRELMEEAGINSEVVVVDLEFKFFDRWKKDCVEKVYACILKDIPEVVLNEEHLFSKWVPINEVLASDYTFPTNFEAFLAVKKQFFAGKK